MATLPDVGGQLHEIERLQVWVNVVTAYEKVRLRLARDHFAANWPVTVLGVIPTRRADLEVALEDLRSIRLIMVSFPSRLVVVGVMALPAVFLELPLAVTGLCLAGAVMFLLLSFVAAIEVTDSTGVTTIPVCLLQRRRVAAFIDAVRHTARANRRESA